MRSVGSGVRTDAEQSGVVTDARALRSTRAVHVVLAIVLVGLPLFDAHVMLPWTVSGLDSASRGRWWLDMGFLVAVHLCLVGACIWTVHRQNLGVESIGLVEHRRPQWLLGLAFLLVISLIGVQLRRIGVIGISSNPRPIDPHGTLERSVFAIEGVFVGACQEIMWRGFGIRGLMSASWMRMTLAVALTSISFGYYHGGVTHQPLGAFIAISMAGVLFAALFLRRGRLWAPMFLHAAVNAIGAVFL